MRISGLASGFDTDEMVKQLMQVERIKVDKVEQNKQTALWRQEQYNSINKEFANFIINTQKDMGLKKTSSTGALFGNSYKRVDYVKKAESSDESVATVSNTGNAANGRFNLDVKTLPQNATFTSANMEDFDFTDIKYMKFKINDNIIEVGDKDRTEDINMDDVVKAINNATKDVEVDGKTIKESLGLEAFYDKGTGRLFLQSIKGETDKDGAFNINLGGTSEGHGFFRALNGRDPETGAPDPSKGKSHSQAGNIGLVTINGVQVDATDGRVNFNGLSIEIKAKGPTSIKVSTNVEGIMEKVEKFIEDYNKLVDEVSDLTTEKVYRDYKPLSPEERKALSEEDLKLWDEKAKSGLLNRDETLTRLLQNMRSNIYKNLEGTGTFTHITQIGISTEKYAMGTSGGKLQIDLEKLRNAIEKDADGVMDLLFQEGDDSSEEIKSNTTSKGVFNRIYDDLIDGMKSIIDKSGPGQDSDLYRGVRSNMLIDFVTKKSSISDIDKSVNEMNRQIDNLNILLSKKEESHYAKFTAMEKQMYKMNNQSGWLAQQFQYY